MTWPTLTPYQVCESNIANDARNVRDLGKYGMRANRETHASVIADCAARLIQARDMGRDGCELEREAEGNLRDALQGWRDR